MKALLNIFLFSIIFFTLGSCSKTADTQISFYYWRTVFRLNDTERETLAINGIEKLYIRYFDVDVAGDGQVFPVAKLAIEDKTDCEIIPVVFIKNQVMKEENWDVNELTDQILSLVKQIHQQQTNAPLHEIQIDCDWSVKSKERFLMFMSTLRKKWVGKLSVTIRLHQIKFYKKTGIPPVDYGVLMYYNMGEIDNIEQNSVYDRNVASQYIQSIGNYPLSLKIALPVFSWGIQVRRDKVVGLWNKKALEDLENNKKLQRLDDKRFKVVMPFFEQGKYFECDDIIIYEGVSKQDLENMARDLSRQKNKNFQNEIIFYDLDSINIVRYDKETFKNVSSLL